MLAESVNFIMKITKKNVSVDVEVAVINGKNVFILKAGSTIELPKPSLKGAIKTRRQIASDTENVTAIDLSCSSLSLLASIITGTQTNGNKYFQNTALSAYCVVPTATANTAPVVTEEKEEEETPAEPVKSEEPVKETPKAEEKPAVVLTKAEIKARKDLSVKLENFVQDFGYEIDPRMKDTLLYQAPADMENYIKNCAKLIGIDDSLINFGSEKFKSPEWDEMKDSLVKINHRHEKINKKLSIYFGPAGTGKTTTALKENPGAVKAIANANDKPSELFTTYNPTTNRYEKTELSKAMEQGKAYILDEGNLLPVQCWQRLQGVLDNSNEITDRGIVIKINPNFKMVTTMNLITNCGKRPLPNPIVSRAAVIREFTSKTVDDTDYIW